MEMRPGRPRESDVRNIQGMGVRLIANNQLGSSSGTSGDLPATIAAARKAALFGRPAVIDFPAPQELPGVENFDPEVARLMTADLAEWLAEAFQAERVSDLRSISPRRKLSRFADTSLITRVCAQPIIQPS